MKTCWTCRRRRLKCDGAFPYCQKCQTNHVECLGYEKPLKWVGGMAARGNLKNSSVDFSHPYLVAARQTIRDASQSYHGAVDVSSNSSDSETSPDHTAVTNLVNTKNIDEETMISVLSFSLTEPIYQDLSGYSRNLVRYFEQRICPFIVVFDGIRNPFRQLIPLIGNSKAMVQTIMAISACHSIHEISGLPVVPTINKLELSSRTEVPDLNPSRTYLHYKNQALRFLSDDLANSKRSAESSTLATVILLMVLDLIESGAGSWSIHLEGAKRLMAAGVGKGATDLLSDALDGLTEFDIFGSTLLHPGVLSKSLKSRLAAKYWKEAPDLSIVGCPIELLLAIDFMASKRQTNGSEETTVAPKSITLDFSIIQSTFESILDFDAQNWAKSMSGAIPMFSTISSTELECFCLIWKLAAQLYAMRIMHSYGFDCSSNPMTATEDLIDGLIAQYECLMHEDLLIKCLIWPAFIAGAESTNVRQRDWALKILEKVWALTLCANAKYATSVLRSLWEMQDSAAHKASAGGNGTMYWDWIFELASKDDRWLFF